LNFFTFETPCRIRGTIGDDLSAVERDVALLRVVQTLPSGAGMIEPDAVKPGGEIGVPAKLTDGLIGGEKHFLRYLRSFIVVSQEPVNQIEYRSFMPPHQNLEGVGVTLLDAPDAFGVTYPFGVH
jgi:hypothetical protein